MIMSLQIDGHPLGLMVLHAGLVVRSYSAFSHCSTSPSERLIVVVPYHSPQHAVGSLRRSTVRLITWLPCVAWDPNSSGRAVESDNSHSLILRRAPVQSIRQPGVGCPSEQHQLRVCLREGSSKTFHCIPHYSSPPVNSFSQMD